MSTNPKRRKQRPKTPAPRWRDNLTVEQANEFFEAMRAAPALMTDKDIEDCERAFQEDGFCRRAALVVLGMTGADYIAKVESDRRFAVIGAGELLEWIKYYLGRLDQQREVLNAARDRAMAALCNRSDMEEVMAQAKLQAFQQRPSLVVNNESTPGASS